MHTYSYRSHVWDQIFWRKPRKFNICNLLWNFPPKYCKIDNAPLRHIHLAIATEPGGIAHNLLQKNNDLMKNWAPKRVTVPKFDNVQPETFYGVVSNCRLCSRKFPQVSKIHLGWIRIFPPPFLIILELMPTLYPTVGVNPWIFPLKYISMAPVTITIFMKWCDWIKFIMNRTRSDAYKCKLKNWREWWNIHVWRIPFETF